MPGVTGEKLYSSHTESLISVFFKELIKFSAAHLYLKSGHVVALDTSRWTVMHRLMDDWISFDIKKSYFIPLFPACL